MANSITTLVAREQMAKARVGEQPLPKITQMAFGRGGTDNNGKPLQPNETQTTLKTELIRKPIDSYEFVNNVTVRYSCEIAGAELMNTPINEIGLIDEFGNLVAVKNMTDKVKDDDMVFIFEIEDQY